MTNRPLSWLRYKLTAAVCIVALAVPVLATAAEQEGYFEVRSASAALVNGVYELDARLQLVLSDEALNALESEVTLTIKLDIEVIRRRRFWPDATTAELTVDYQLEYHALSERYIVRNLNSGEQDSFATLYSALNNLGRIQKLPVIDAALIEPGKRYRFRVRAILDIKQYSAPLRILVFWRDEWRLKSEWFEWILSQ